MSLLDLGRTGADGLWAQALRAEPQHLESSYNQALHAWGQGRIGDEELLARVEEAKRANAQVPRAAELLGQAKAAATGAGGLAESTRAVKADAPVAVAVTPDGSRVLAFDKAGSEVRIWKASGEPLRPLLPVELRVRAMAVAPDGRSVLLAGEGAPPQLWDIAAGRATRQFPRVPGHHDVPGHQRRTAASRWSPGPIGRSACSRSRRAGRSTRSTGTRRRWPAWP